MWLCCLRIPQTDPSEGPHKRHSSVRFRKADAAGLASIKIPGDDKEVGLTRCQHTSTPVADPPVIQESSLGMSLEQDAAGTLLTDRDWTWVFLGGHFGQWGRGYAWSKTGLFSIFHRGVSPPATALSANGDRPGISKRFPKCADRHRSVQPSLQDVPATVPIAPLRTTTLTGWADRSMTARPFTLATPHPRNLKKSFF